MLNNYVEGMFCIAIIAMFTRTSNIVERLFSLAKPTFDDQRKRANVTNAFRTTTLPIC